MAIIYMIPCLTPNMCPKKRVMLRESYRKAKKYRIRPCFIRIGVKDVCQFGLDVSKSQIKKFGYKR